MSLYVFAKPFFLNNNGLISSLLASSSASASSASSYQPAFEENPYSENIAIVPPSHIGKPMKLQFNVFNFTRSNEDNIIFPNDTSTQETTQTPIDTTTEASFFKKKINKIIRKIVTISQIKHAIHNFNTDEEGSGFQYPAETTTEPSENYTVEPRENEIRSDKIRRPVEEYGAPFKFNLQENQENDRELLEEVNERDAPEKKEIPAALGIFVLEMFASLVGLTVGAVNHINFLSNGQHNNTL